MMDKYKEREHLRDKIKSYWQSGHKWSDVEKQVCEQLNEIHAQIVEAELQDPNLSKERRVYSVCGWSERHGYFRNKYSKSATLDEAKKEFEVVKNDPGWRIPTLIVKQTHLRKNSPAMVDFDGTIDHLGFSDYQEIVLKSMCGAKGFNWNDLLSGLDNRYTY